MHQMKLDRAAWLARTGQAIALAAAFGLGGQVASPLAAEPTTPTVFTTTLAEGNQRTAEVSTEELRQMLIGQSAIVFDARPPAEYAISHIPGARNVAQKAGTPASLYISDAAEIQRQVP